MELVIDASVSGSWIIESEKTPVSEKLLEKIVARQIVAVVPSLWIYEMLNILKTCVLRKRISAEEAEQGVKIIQSIPVETLHPDLSQQRSMFAFSVEHDISMYDAAYIAIARHVSCSFLTADEKLLSLKDQLPFISALDEISDTLLGN